MITEFTSPADKPEPDDDGMFDRKGVDPVSRCEGCGAAVAAEGKADHRLFHARLEVVLRDLARTTSLGEIQR